MGREETNLLPRDLKYILYSYLSSDTQISSLCILCKSKNPGVFHEYKYPKKKIKGIRTLDLIYKYLVNCENYFWGFGRDSLSYFRPGQSDVDTFIERRNTLFSLETQEKRMEYLMAIEETPKLVYYLEVYGA
jgi:hypothetical protein